MIILTLMHQMASMLMLSELIQDILTIYLQYIRRLMMLLIIKHIIDILLILLTGQNGQKITLKDFRSCVKISIMCTHV